MPYGITSVRAHLIETTPLTPVAGEIDWSKLAQHVSGELVDFSPPPTFAGRYFLGHATEDEINAGLGFCLWAHGEGGGNGEGLVHLIARDNGLGTPAPVPLKIVPLQRADPERQSWTGHGGLFMGSQDAKALAAYLDGCLAVGDLAIVDTQQILVFLEVADGTAPSPDYWAAWSTTIRDTVLYPARQAERTSDDGGMQPLLPAILCAFEFDDATGTFLPQKKLREECLDVLPSGRGFQTRCHGFWARRLVDDPGVDSSEFGWLSLGEYQQPLEIPGLEAPYMARVPVRYLRLFEGLPGPEVVDEATRATLALVTIDAPADGGVDSPLGGTFTTTNWAAHRQENGDLAEVPSLLGIDTAATITDAAAECLAGKQIVVKRLPYRNIHTPVSLEKPCRIAIRYYRPSGTKRLGLAEATRLSRNKLQVAAVWQHTASLGAWAPYVQDLIRPFVNGEGKDDGKAAFTYAAEVVHQPPYTPVYFAVDFEVGNFDPGYTNGLESSVPVPTPGIDTIVTYFRDLHRGYLEYLATHPTTPYYIGAYTQPDTAAALYRAGLCHYFWQQPWAWGSQETDLWIPTPFLHLNVWQIGMFGTAEVVADNAALETCNPEATEPGHIWVDINAAWGDPGTFQVFE